ncbi:pilus assembly protein TadG-related protein [Jannaschia sp. R86511]|uniref:pilus assembly protein TadG-related protein n=1 Tax=Jannaschia sp. R86511 TaxID=3093853 RepID=UPI0036D2C872
MRARPRGDTGATAIVFTVVVLVLLAVAALAVDLTNLYAQRAVAQARADTAAFAAAQALPDACADADGLRAVDRAARDALRARDGGDTGEPEVVVLAAVVDPDVPLRVVGPADADCRTAGASVEVRTPSREVPFVFAGVFGVFDDRSGRSSATVAAVARVELAAPDLLPLVLPAGCVDRGEDEVYLLTSTPEPSTPEPSGTATADPSEPEPSEPEPSEPEPSEPEPSGTATAEPSDPTTSAPPTAGSPPPTSPAPTDPPSSGDPTATPAPPGTPEPVAPRATDAVPATPTGALGVLLRPVPRVVTVPDDGCAATNPEAGLGVLDSPLGSGETGPEALARNLRVGLDHLVQARPGATPAPTLTTQVCEDDGRPAGAVLDRPGAVGTPTCVRVSTDVDPAAVAAALQARRDDAGVPPCRAVLPGASPRDVVQACYLREGRGLDDVRDAALSPGPPSLDEAVLADPRFVVVPEVALTGPVGGEFVSVTGLRGAFLPDDWTDPEDGLLAYVFPLQALPPDVFEVGAGPPRTFVLTRPRPAPTPGGGP